MEFCKWLDNQSLLIKVIVCFPVWGLVVGFIYRLLKFLNNTKNTNVLIGAILFVLGPIGAAIALVDWILIILKGKPTLLAD